MAQALQRVIDARPREQGQRLRFAMRRFVRAVGDAVVHGRQVGQVEQVAHGQAAARIHIAFDMVMLGERKMHGDGLGAHAHFQVDILAAVMVFQQQGELVEVIVAEQIGARQRGFKYAGTGDKAVGQRRVGARHGVSLDAHEGVAGAYALVHVFAGDKALQRIAQVFDAAAVNGLHLFQRQAWIVEAGGGDEGGRKQADSPCSGSCIPL